MGYVLVLTLVGNGAGRCRHLVILQAPAVRMGTVLRWRVTGEDAVGPGGGLSILVDEVFKVKCSEVTKERYLGS